MSDDTGYPGSGLPGHADPPEWAIVRRVSPREDVRVAAVDAAGKALNLYPAFANVDGPVPASPWAMYLTDDRTWRYHFIGFDLDTARGDVDADLTVLVQWLNDLGIEYTVCSSGPSGGRHIWLSMLDPIPAPHVRALAIDARLALPTLDISPLTNAATGCLRPPMSPHRHGGRSTILSGPTGGDTLRPAVSAVQFNALHELIHSAVTTDSTQHDQRENLPAGTVPVLLDAAGAPHLPGRRRTLSLGITTELATTPTDPSVSLRRILIGAARARWHRADIEALITTAPGLEHARTRHQPAGRPRTRRSPHELTALVARKWASAVRWAADNPPAPPVTTDPTWTPRATQIGELIDAVQTSADASPGRWASATGPSARRVLDALCVLAATAVTPTIEADIRRLALMTGLGRETTRLRLHELASEGRIALGTPATGRRAHHWTLQHPTINRYPHTHSKTRPQGEAAPEPSPPLTTLRDTWLTTLQHRLTDLTHDLWTTRGLGPHLGRIYQTLNHHPKTVIELVALTHYPLGDITTALTLLRKHKLTKTDRTGRVQRSTLDRRDTAARTLGVNGALDDRAQRYQQEKVLWAWWCDEVDWMRLKKSDPAKRRRAHLMTGQLALDTDRPYGPMPRSSHGRIDMPAARSIVNAA